MGDEVTPVFTFLVGCVAIGHPAPEPKEEARKADLRRRRKPLDELVRWERW